MAKFLARTWIVRKISCSVFPVHLIAAKTTHQTQPKNLIIDNPAVTHSTTFKYV